MCGQYIYICVDNTYIYVNNTHIHMCEQYTYILALKDRHRRDMWWLRLVGSVKLKVSSAEYSLFYRALLQKRAISLGSLLIVATPYECRQAFCLNEQAFWLWFGYD